MRADRLLSILLLLQNQGRMTSRELAEKLEVSERTIHRDMEALSAAGVPVYSERGACGGWALSEGYRTNLTGLKSEEIQSLLLVTPTVLLNDLGMRGSFEVAYQKLMAASPKALQQDAAHVRQRIHIDGAGWHQSNEEFPHLSTIQEAVWQERKLYMRYQREESVVERVVHPLGLAAKRSTWYLVAEVENELRTYRISRLLDARIQEETFVRPADFDLARYWEESTEQFKASLPRYLARVKVNEKLLKRLSQERYLKMLSTQPVGSGWVEAEIQFHTLESACEMILGFGSRMQVLEPEELRTKVIAETQATLALYGFAES